MNDRTLPPRVIDLITDAQARYIRAIDDGNCDDWPTFFTDDCFYMVTSADNYSQGMEAGLIWLDSKNMLRDRIVSLHEANVYERYSYRHILGHPYLVEQTEFETRCETPFIVARITREGPTDLFATGRYIDKWRIDDTAALIAERIVVLDSNQIDTLLGFPL